MNPETSRLSKARTRDAGTPRRHVFRTRDVESNWAETLLHARWRKRKGGGFKEVSKRQRVQNTYATVDRSRLPGEKKQTFKLLKCRRPTQHERRSECCDIQQRIYQLEIILEANVQDIQPCGDEARLWERVLKSTGFWMSHESADKVQLYTQALKMS